MPRLDYTFPLPLDRLVALWVTQDAANAADILQPAIRFVRSAAHQHYGAFRQAASDLQRLAPRIMHDTICALPLNAHAQRSQEQFRQLLDGLAQDLGILDARLDYTPAFRRAITPEEM